MVDADTAQILVRGDVVRLRQVLQTLAEYAVALSEGGRVSIAADVQDEAKRSLVVRFDVLSAGNGSPADAVERFFDALESGGSDPLAADGEGGLGMGLTLARRLAELMGGRVEIERCPPGGIRFSLSVRLDRGRRPPSSLDATDASPAHPPRTSEGPARVLVADDDEISLEVAKRRLERLGHRVETAPNGRIAVEKASAAEYDLVLLDLHMPELDGRGVCRAIRAMPEGWRVRIVALSGSDDEAEARACLADGMDGFVTKPLDATRARALVTGLGSAGRAPTRLPVDFVDLAIRHDDELEAGLEVAGGDVDRYRHLLAVFATAHQDDVRFVEEARRSGHVDQALTRLHSLKGAASSLGQFRLAHAASQIEQCLEAAGDGRELDLSPLERELEALSSLIVELARTAAPGTPGVGAQGGYSSDDVQGVLATLAGLLGSDDADAPPYAARHRVALRAVYGADVDRLVEAVDAYDYETAKGLLAKLRTVSNERRTP